MKRFKSRLAGALAIALLAAPLTTAQAADTTDPAQAAATTAAMDRTPQTKEDKAAAAAQKKAQQQAQRAQKKATQREKAAERKREREARFKTLFVDNGFTYYLDSKNSQWIPRPNNHSERIIDAWVRLVENTAGASAREDRNIHPYKYFLEHYYISPERREIMFISELEVTGRPENAIHERPYNNANWEKLVPGSIEDDLFDAIVLQMNKRSKRHGAKDRMSLRDMIEEYARISL